MTKKEELIRTLEDLGFPDENVVLTVDEFFSNDDFFNGPDDGMGSIGVNLIDYVSPKTFYETFKKLKGTGKVSEIYVQITDADEPEEWFFTDTVYVVGQMSPDEISEIVESLSPDEIQEASNDSLPINLRTKDNDKVFYLWWD